MRTKRSSSLTILMTPIRRGTWACGVFALREENFGSQEKAPSRKGRLTCGCEGWGARTAAEASSPPGRRADLVAQPKPTAALRSAPNTKPFNFRSGLGKIAANLGALLFLATPPSVWRAVLTTRSRYLLGRRGSGRRKVQRLSAVAASGSASTGGSVSMRVTVTGG
jgi:hypothetical protein